MRGLITIAALLASIPVAAQAQFAPAPTPVAHHGLAMGISSRVRYETIDGQARPDIATAEDLVNLRTILSAEYHKGIFSVGGELWDSRIYSARPDSAAGTGEVDAVEPVQAWVGLDLGGALGTGTHSRLQVGRFTLALASRRLIAADEYRNTTNSNTGVRLDVQAPGNINVTAIYVLPEIRLPEDGPSVRANAVALDRESLDYQFWGFDAAKGKAIGNALIGLSYFHVSESDRPGRPTRNRRLDTVSLRLLRAPAPGTLDLDMEAIGQLGRIRADTTPAAPSLPVAAWFVHAEAGYQFAAPWRPHLSLEYDRASGDKPGRTYSRFDTLFGMRRADLAMGGLYASLSRANVSALGLRFEVTPSKRLDAFVAPRALWLASRYDSFSTTGVRDASGRSGSFAGVQVDARVRWWAVPKHLMLEADGLILAKGRFLRDAPNSPRDGDTHYLSLNASVFF